MSPQIGTREEIRDGEAHQTPFVLAEATAHPGRLACGTPPAIRLLPDRGILHAPAQPQEQECGENAEQEHDAPRAVAETPDEEPQPGGEQATDPEGGRESSRRASAPRRSPQLGDQGRARSELTTQPQPGEEAEGQEHPVALRHGAQAGECGIEHDGQHERSAPSEIVGEHPTGHSTGGPSEQSHRCEAAEIERELVRRDEIADGGGADENQRIRLIAVEEPAESAGQQRAPGGRASLGRERTGRRGRRIAGGRAGPDRHRFRLGICDSRQHYTLPCHQLLGEGVRELGDYGRGTGGPRTG